MTYRTAREKAEARRKAAANRLKVVAANVAEMAEFAHPHASVTIGETTSNAPLIRLAFPDGAVFNITITKARK